LLISFPCTNKKSPAAIATEPLSVSLAVLSLKWVRKRPQIIPLFNCEDNHIRFAGNVKLGIKNGTTPAAIYRGHGTKKNVKENRMEVPFLFLHILQCGSCQCFFDSAVPAYYGKDYMLLGSASHIYDVDIIPVFPESLLLQRL